MGQSSEEPAVVLRSDWYSPRRLHDSPVKYDFPGDRFIPNRSLMNLDQAHNLLTNKTKEATDPKFGEAYRRKLIQSLDFDSDGRPFRMLVFRGSPKSSKRSNHMDEMRMDDPEALSNGMRPYLSRRLPKRESRVLQAPDIQNNFYANLIDWGKNNILAVALGGTLYLWNSETKNVQKLFRADGHDDFPASVAWSENARSLGVGFMESRLQIWDAETSKCIQSLQGHKARIGALAWNGHILSSGSLDRSIINHDVRAGSSPTSSVRSHTAEVCGLKWSTESNVLASGGNENFVFIWEASKMSSSNFLHKFCGHRAAVKALAWSPYQANTLASGGGTGDGCIKIWDIQKGTCIRSVDTNAQICGLEWNRHHKEILSGHGYSTAGLQNHLCLWRYPSMTKIGEISGHESRVINLSQSPDGLTVVSAGADETLRFWDIFGPPRTEDCVMSSLDSLLSLKTSPIR